MAASEGSTLVALRLPVELWSRARNRARKLGEPVRAFAERAIEREIDRTARAGRRSNGTRGRIVGLP